MGGVELPKHPDLSCTDDDFPDLSRQHFPLDDNGFSGSSRKDQNCGFYERRPSSIETSSAFELWQASTSKNDPCLEGFSLEEVRRYAERIQLKQVFRNFDEFEFSLDCWCSLDYRAKHCARSKKWYRLRICRFGAKIRGKGLPIFHEDKSSSGSKTSRNGPDPKRENTLVKKCSFVHHGINNMSDTGGLEESIQEYSTVANHSGKKSHDVRGSTAVNVNEVAVNVCGSSVGDIGGHSEEFQDPRISRLACGMGISWRPQHSKRPNQPIFKNSFSEPSVSLDVPTEKRRKSGEARVPTARNGACGQFARYILLGKENGTSCKDEVCEWRVRCQRHKSTGLCEITVCNLEHTCPGHIHTWRGPTHKAKWLSMVLADRVINQPNIPVGSLVEVLAQTYKKRTTYFPAWRCKEICRDWMNGGERAGFHLIPSFIHAVKEADPFATAAWDVWNLESAIFKRLFICPSAMKNIIPYVQKVVGLDVCHTKNRKYPMQIFIASMLDGNANTIILAFGISPRENNEEWEWFCAHLKKAIPALDDHRIVIVSDRQKGLLHAVRTIFPQNIHSMCAQHLRQNVRTRYGKVAEGFFIACLYARTREK